MAGLSQIVREVRAAITTIVPVDYLAAVRSVIDQIVLTSLAPLALLILLSGIDDVLVDLLWLYSLLRYLLLGRSDIVIPPDGELAAQPEKRIAIFVPLWNERDVIGDMLAHNIAAIRYRSYDFFIGAYPNDAGTLEAVRATAIRFPNVHLTLCPHDGPTSKPDCLNWIYQSLLLYEESNGVRFDVVLTHDAEDIIHSESLRWVNHFTTEYGFVQLPVLPLPTPVSRITHGVYCDEFAEFHTRELPARHRTGGFVPSAGVGTACSREAIEAVAQSSANRVFEPGCLTEDYENGYRMHALGVRQIFLPITRRGTFVATREFFPETATAAIRQRSRWVTGIALQGWERHGWAGGVRQAYWLWRDRKGLVTNPLSLLANLAFAYGLASGLWDRALPAAPVRPLLMATLAFAMWRLAVRSACSARVYGLAFGLLAPLRVVPGNFINSAAALRALLRYAWSRWRHQPLVWVKTEHAYPSRMTLVAQRRRLGEILVGTGYIDQETLDRAVASKPAGLRLGEYLVALEKLSEEDLYEALSLQQHLPLASIVPSGVSRRVMRALPARVAAEWKVLPFWIENGRLDVASPELPVAAMESALRSHTALELRFHLITPRRYRELLRRVG